MRLSGVNLSRRQLLKARPGSTPYRLVCKAAEQQSASTFGSQSFLGNSLAHKLLVGLQKTAADVQLIKDRLGAYSKVSSSLQKVDHLVDMARRQRAPSVFLLADEVLQVQVAVQQSVELGELSVEAGLKFCESFTELSAVVDQGLLEWDRELLGWQQRAEFGEIVLDVREVAASKLEHLGICTWRQLAVRLKKEKKKAQSSQVVTSALKAALTEMGFTWEEWLMLASVAQARNESFHPEVDIDEAAEKIDSVPMPEELQIARPVLKKAISLLQAEFSA
jgi:hypothetical protein